MRRHATIFALLVALAAAGPARAEVRASAVRGLTGSVEVVDATGEGLRPRADLDLRSPLLVRIVSVEGDAYRLEFIGTEPGIIDLRTALERPDGSFPETLDPVPVEIVRRLELGAGTDVAAEAIPAPRLRGGYLATLATIGVAWALVPVVVVGRRAAARWRHDAPVVTDHGPSLAERLEPLVLAAAERSMSVEERGRLELLLLAHLEAESGLAAASRDEAIRRLRADADAGPLVTAVETWLHRPGDVESRRAEVAGLLAPFRRARRTVEATS